MQRCILVGENGHLIISHINSSLVSCETVDFDKWFRWKSSWCNVRKQARTLKWIQTKQAKSGQKMSSSYRIISSAAER